MPENPQDGQWRPGLAVLGPALTTLAVLVVASELIPARPDAGPVRSRSADRLPR
jgi:hypothetical protein